MPTDLPNFEKAEYAADSPLSAEQCSRCRQTFVNHFYRLDGEPLCELCIDAAKIAGPEGGDLAFLRAGLFGAGAAIVGSILYAAVELTTGWTIGYVALAVGWLVGKAMKRGSLGRGGRRYQFLAVLMTYCSVSCASLIVILYTVHQRNPHSRIIVNERFVLLLARYSVLWPLLELKHGMSGIIGLIILLVGMQAAWSMTAGSEYRITGPHPAAGDAAATIF
jgi:hypothetical protein